MKDIPIPDLRDFITQLHSADDASQVQQTLDTATRYLDCEDFQYLKALARQRICALNVKAVGPAKARWS